eukprot:3589098-Pleurochrysis_carterae.AAC.1
MQKRDQPGSQVTRTPRGEQLSGRVKGLSIALHRLQLGRRERIREGRQSERGEGVKRKRRCQAVRRRRVKQCIVSNQVAKVARPDCIDPEAQIVMVRVRGGDCERSPQARICTLVLEKRVRHGDLGRE